jgi:signal transduction histidine kinase
MKVENEHIIKTSYFKGERKMAEINFNATRNLGVKLLKCNLKINAYKAMNGIVPSKSLKEKISGLNENRSKLITASVQNILTENAELLEKNSKLTQTLSDAEKTLRTKEKFFDIMAHDLKNPISGIASLCEIFPVDGNKEEIKSIVDVLSQASNGAMNVLMGLNELRRANSGKLMPSEFKLREVAESVFETAKSSVNLNQVSLVNSIAGDISVNADKRIVEIIIRNLVSNAIKFTNSGQVELRASSFNGSPVQISVKDTGIGISKETMDKLLVKGDFITTISSRGDTGTGFGIPLCKDFAKLLGGDLTGVSEKGKGTTFTFTIPKIKDQLLMAKI